MPSYQHIVDEQHTYAILQNVVNPQDDELFDFDGMEYIPTGDSVIEPTVTRENIEPPTMAENQPFISIIEQPANSFRYRYKSEKGSHGGIKGESASRSKKTFPTVKVENCLPSLRKKIVIKVSLYTNEPRQNLLQPHPYELTGKNSGGAKVDENFTAVFKQLNITTRKKEEVLELLKERIKAGPSAGISYDEASLESKALKLMKSITLDSARLCFEAFSTDTNAPLCEKVFSNPINNQKSAATGDLKIVRLSHIAGKCSGGEVVILWCDKVKKEDIQVRFFDEQGWEAFGQFSAADIHHQVSIAFAIPPYPKPIKFGSQEVSIELVRPSDQERSKPVDFKYIPDDVSIKGRVKLPNVQIATEMKNEFTEVSRKRKRPNTEDDIKSSALDSPQSMDEGDLKDVSDYFSSNLPGERPNTEDDIKSSALDSPQSMDEEELNDLLEYLSSTVPGVDWSGIEISDEFPEGSGNEHSYVNEESEDLSAFDETEFSHQPMMLTRVVADGLNDISSSMDSLSLNDCFKKKLDKSKTQKASNDFIVGVKRILENRNESTYLHYAAHLIPLLDEDGNSLLHLAIMEQSSNLNLILKMLEVASEDVINHRNKLKETPLHLAVKINNVMILFLLLVRGGDPNAVDGDGNNCLHLASKLGHLNCLKVLMPSPKIKRSWKCKISDVDALNYDGMSALHLAVTHNFEDCMNHLLNCKADVNLCEKKSGRTSLHLAIDRPFVLQRILKQPEVDVYVEDFGGNTPVQLACLKHRKSFEIVSAQLKDDKNEILKFLENLNQSEGECRRLSETESLEDGECSQTESDGESTDSSEFEDAVEYFSPISSNQPVAKKSNLTKTEEELRQYLDRDDNWKKLANLIGLDCEHVAMFERGLSPSQTVLRQIENLYPSDPLQTIIVRLLRVAELEEGVNILERNS